MSASTRRSAVLLAAAVLGLVPLLLPDYWVFQFTMLLSYAAALLGLNILVGYNGQISLGHGAFFACGAYAAAIAMERFGVPYWLCPALAGAACFLLGYLIGFPALRLGGIHLALATFALAVAVPQLLKHKWLQGWTGGVQGVVVLKPEAPVAGILGVALNADRWLYLFTLLTVGALFWLAGNFLAGRMGRALIAIRDHPVAASTMGVDLARVKSAAFGLSAAYAGVGGALAAMAVGYVAPDSFPGFLSITLLVGIVVGGLATLQGALLGAVFVLLVPNLAEQVSKSAPSAIYGLLLMAVMALVPAGIAGALSAAWKRVPARRRGALPPDARLQGEELPQPAPKGAFHIKETP